MSVEAMLDEARAPELVSMAAVTVAVTSGRTLGFRPSATRRRTDELLRDLLAELAAQEVTAVGSASMSVVAVDDSGVGVEVGVVVHDPVRPTDTVRVVLRPRHEAATLLVSGDQTDQAWGRLRGFLLGVDVVASRRPYTSFQHPRGTDERTWTTQLVQPVEPLGG
ncbi:hypothetical protein [Curtobacterium aetherium]|uniref:Uncharacterized protein n=1 Tax=Curtobacterium aetherium TaxID=2841594 RepID=A0ACD1E7L4_9MICO|nr:hypothetical protein [Curtobacterium sp. L6-1]QWS34953.1 hypothetical protein KM842_07485 [Curtobacterium sp. L6-1]